MFEKDKIREASGPYHHFWLLHEGERKYDHCRELIKRRPPPISMSLDVAQYMFQSLGWITTVTTTGDAIRAGFGLYQMNIVNHTGGESLNRICSGWAQIFSQGPEPLVLFKRQCEIDLYGFDGNPFKTRLYNPRTRDFLNAAD